MSNRPRWPRTTLPAPQSARLQCPLLRLRPHHAWRCIQDKLKPYTYTPAETEQENDLREVTNCLWVLTSFLIHKQPDAVCGDNVHWFMPHQQHPWMGGSGFGCICLLELCSQPLPLRAPGGEIAILHTHKTCHAVRGSRRKFNQHNQQQSTK